MKNILRFILFVPLLSCTVSQVQESESHSGILSAESDFFRKLEKEAGNSPNIYSLIIYKNERLLSEKYYNGADEKSLLELRSITKSVTSLLIGKLVYDGKVQSLDNKIIDYYPDYKSNKDSSLINNITINHILDMTSGFEWDENVEAIKWYTNISNPLEYILSKRIENVPGSSWNYNSGSVHLLASIFDNSENQNQAKYAEKYLFQKLDIDNYSWDRDPQGVVRPDAGLALKAMDLAKIGTLFLEDGSFKGEVVIPAEWINKIRNFKIDLNSSYGLMENLHYNNLWWMAHYKELEIYFALGYGGQFLLLVPEQELIVVTNHEYKLSGSLASQQARNFINTIFIPLLDHFLK